MPVLWNPHVDSNARLVTKHFLLDPRVQTVIDANANQFDSAALGKAWARLLFLEEAFFGLREVDEGEKEEAHEARLTFPGQFLVFFMCLELLVAS
jgi:hypothetical protein